MKNIVSIEKDEIENFLLEKVWKTDNFKNLHQNNIFFKKLIARLKEAPIYFFDLSHPKGRNHLTSIFRFIPFRDYENKYINDLYYLHELCHCANYIPSEEVNYSKWSQKLSYNELYASLVSEVFIYFLDPTLVGKTFSPLWAERFTEKIKNNKDYIGNNYFLPFHPIEDKEWSIHYRNIDVLSLEKNNWPNYINSIIVERERLRSLDNSDNLDQAEKIIVNYNLSHKKWIQLWQEHYLKIDVNLIALKQGKLSTKKFLDYVISQSDNFGRPFFPKSNSIL